MIAIENINFTTRDNITLLDNVNCIIQPGKITSVMGANGAGKSTLLKIISNEIKATKGRIVWDNKIMHQIKNSDLAKKRSVLRQQYHLTLPFSAYDIIEMGRYPYFQSKATERCKQVINEVAEYVGVHNLTERNYLTLSGGEQQRVQLARVLAQVWDAPEGQKLIILDEPVSALDIYYQHHLLALVQQLAKEKSYTIIAVVHDLNLAFQYSDDILLLKKGKQIAFGNCKTVLNEDNILQTFNIHVNLHHNEDTGQTHVSVDNIFTKKINQNKNTEFFTTN